jgi:hypothetical protein
MSHNILSRSDGVGNRGGRPLPYVETTTLTRFHGVRRREGERKTTFVIAPLCALLYIETHLNLGGPATRQGTASLGVQR